MPNNLKIPSPWSQLVLFIGLLVAGIVIYGVIDMLIHSLMGIPQVSRLGDIPIDSRSIAVMKFLQGLSSIIVFGFPAYFYSRQTFADRPLYRLGFRPAVKGNFYLLAILLLVVSFPLEGWLGELNKQFPLPTWMIQMEKDNDRLITAFLRTDSLFGVIVNLLVVAALPAIFEEVCFRGALQRIMIHIFKSPWTGIIVTAILFSAFHLQFQGFLPRMFLGVLLGAACWYSGSIWTAIIAHFVFNGIQVVAAMYYPAVLTENPSVPLYAGLISLVIVAGLLYRMRMLSTVTYKGEFGLS